MVTVGRAVSYPGAAALVTAETACSRRQTSESGANCGRDADGRRISRSSRPKLKPGLIGVIRNSAHSRSQWPKVRRWRDSAAYRRAMVSKSSAGRPVTSSTSVVGAPSSKAPRL